MNLQLIDDMDLKDLLKENEDRLFEEYISIPTISHAFDRQRFLKYAIVSNANRTGFNRERIRVLRQKGLREHDFSCLFRFLTAIKDKTHSFECVTLGFTYGKRIIGKTLRMEVNISKVV